MAAHDIVSYPWAEQIIVTVSFCMSVKMTLPVGDSLFMFYIVLHPRNP